MRELQRLELQLHRKLSRAEIISRVRELMGDFEVSGPFVRYRD